MTEYIFPIKMAFFIFPFVAFFITIPYMLIQYRKFGSIPVLRTVIVYSFILYLINAYFLVILPLPPIDEVAKYTTPTTQLIPFQFISDMIEQSKFVWSDPSTYIEIITNPVIYQVLYNILMILPFGFYLRYYFKKSLLETIGFSFVLSLFFELTQLSGLYGIYPRGYRLFDVDDLIINTFGGFVGYIITPLITWMLPSKENLDKISYERGKQVSFTRRFFAFVIDNMIVLFIMILIAKPLSIPMIDSFFQTIGLSINYVCSIVIYFMILLPIMDGISIGKRIVKLRVVSEDNESVKWWQCVIRYGMLYLIILPAPVISASLMEQIPVDSISLQLFLIAVIGIFMILYFVFLIQIFIGIFQKKKLLYYERISHTKNISTVTSKAESEAFVEKNTDEINSILVDENCLQDNK